MNVNERKQNVMRLLEMKSPVICYFRMIVCYLSIIRVKLALTHVYFVLVFQSLA